MKQISKVWKTQPYQR